MTFFSTPVNVEQFLRWGLSITIFGYDASISRYLNLKSKMLHQIGEKTPSESGNGPKNYLEIGNSCGPNFLYSGVFGGADSKSVEIFKIRSTYLEI